MGRYLLKLCRLFGEGFAEGLGYGFGLSLVLILAAFLANAIFGLW